MARLTYGFLGLAAITLVSGFFVRNSSLPLLISIALSVAVSALILYGWSKRVREVSELGETEETLEDFEVTQVEEPRRSRTRRSRVTDETAAMEVVDDSEFAPPKPKRSKAKPKPEPKPKPKAKPKATPKAKPKPKPAPPKRKLVRRVAVVPGAARYHKPGCRFARSANVRMVSEAIARDRGYEPCDVCKP